MRPLLLLPPERFVTGRYVLHGGEHTGNLEGPPNDVSLVQLQADRASLV